jgi:hypothetical protein
MIPWKLQNEHKKVFITIFLVQKIKLNLKKDLNYLLLFFRWKMDEFFLCRKNMLQKL